MKLTAALFLVLLLIGCGGTASAPPTSTSVSPPTATPPVTSGGTTPTTPPAAPGTVTVAAGQTVRGVDIAVVAPATSPALNAQDLGVAALTGTGSAYNTGDVIHRGQTARVLLFGPGLDGSGIKVSIVGPAGITTGTVTAIKATDNTPGISFVATVAGDAALGARTVSVENSQGDISTFTGGLEVVR